MPQGSFHAGSAAHSGAHRLTAPSQQDPRGQGPTSGRPGEVTGISDGQPPKDGWLVVTGTFSIFPIYWE